MSLHGYPTLNLDVSARRGEAIAAGAVLCLAVVASLLLWTQHRAIAGLICLTSVLVIGRGFYRMGWLGGSQRTVRIVCQADDLWIVADAEGRRTECRLAPGSRVTSYALWLQWLEERPPLLLVHGDVPADEFRRLVTRLRLSRPLSVEGVDRAL